MIPNCDDAWNIIQGAMEDLKIIEEGVDLVKVGGCRFKTAMEKAIKFEQKALLENETSHIL